MQACELRVGIFEAHADRPAEVAIDFGATVNVLSFPPEFAVHLAQMLVKNARIAGFTGEFVELPIHANTH